MHPCLKAALVATALCASGAALAEPVVSEQRSIDARVMKVRIDGVVDLSIKQGASAALVVVGDAHELAHLSTTQTGDTLVITENSHVHFGRHNGVRAELTLPSLQALTSTGVGKTEMSGFGGEQFTLNLDGAGSVTVNSSFKRVDARLGGVGSMTLNAGAAESIKLNLRGAGGIHVSGQSKMLHATLGGLGSLQARQLQADAVELDMSGLGSATVFAKQSANLNLSGLGSATVYGKPASRSSSARGLGSVRWD